MSVLVTAGDSIKALVVTRSLGEKSVRVYTAEEYYPFLSSFSKYSKRAFKYPSPLKYSHLFTSWIVKILTKYNDIETVIPTHSRDTYVISKYKEAIEEQTAVPIPVPEYYTLKLVNDKGALVKLAEKLHIPVPKTYYVESLDQLKVLSSDFQYPVVIKIRESSSSVGVEYAFSREGLIQKYTMLVKRFNLPSGKYPIIQEYIPGDGYGVSLLFNHGKLRAKFTHRRIREYPITGGPSTCRVSVRCPKMEKYAVKLLERLKWHGVAMVEFKLDIRTKKPYLIEVNPRFWGSIYQAVASGVNFPYLLYKMAVDGDVESVFDYNIGVITRNYFIDSVAIVNYILKRERNIKILKELFKLYPDDILKKEDVLPVLGFLYSSSRQIASKKLRKTKRGSL